MMQKRKDDLEFRKPSQLWQQTNYTENSVEIDAELTQLSGEFAA